MQSKDMQSLLSWLFDSSWLSTETSDWPAQYNSLQGSHFITCAMREFCILSVLSFGCIPHVIDMLQAYEDLSLQWGWVAGVWKGGMGGKHFAM